ncbi:PxKF domain-containing protein [Blastococcus saxobsidens]|uniref:Uncharacterized protein n=1 Tax=Blastococcus saxobsidens (strain DD2) TaxID=1146883 RepID=H6RUC9_BLASD|nr:PxKF domain-containing protein [Blastococcus saxobsidens]CCG01894.1 exported protein of unknown function; putative Cadherin domain [Blastococcus saxobsidens DD2]
MRTLTRSKAVAGLTAGLVVAGGGIAWADNIQDDIVNSSTGVTLVAGSATGGTANIKVIGNNSDGAVTDPGCNWDTGENPLVLDIVTPSGVTANPDPLSITGCGVDKTITFTASATAQSGTATVTIQSSPAGGGGYNNQVSIPITVTRPNTPPTVSVTGIDSTSYVIGSEPTAGCSVTDAQEPGLTATPVVNRDALVDGLGDVTVTCSVTDAGGLRGSASTSYTIVAPPNTKPSVAVTGVAHGASYEIGTAPTAGCEVTDAEDGNSSPAAVVTGTLSHGLGSQTATCDYTDEGGLAADTASATYTIVDTGDPTIEGRISPTAPDGSNGWYRTAPTISFACDDAGGSGIQSCTAGTTLGEGAGQSVTGTATDWAGNTATDAVSGIDVDLTDPTAGFDGSIGSVYFGTVPPAPTCTAGDTATGSGAAGCVVTGYSTAVGTHTLTATATDVAGRTGTERLTYTVSAWTLNGLYSPVDMNGVWNTVKGGSTVPLKFEVFAGSTELTTTAGIGAAFTAKAITCPSGAATTDEIEILSTGGTSLRFDTTAGQFIQNWATPKKPGSCYAVTVTTADGSKQTANFILK